MFAGCFGKSPIADHVQFFFDSFAAQLPLDTTQQQQIEGEALKCAFYSNTTYPYAISTSSNEAFSVVLIGWITRKGEKQTAEEILRTFERAGSLLLQEVCGEFLILLHDKSKNSLLVYRDHFGTIPFTYCFIHDLWFFSADQIRLFKILFKDTPISDAYFKASYLTYASNYTETLNPKITKLLPATGVKLSSDGISTGEIYWDPGILHATFKGNEIEAIEQASTLITEHLKLVTSSKEPIATHFSGGIDSSLLTSMLAGLVEDQTKIHAFSWSPEEEQFTDLSFADERHKIKEHAAQLNISLHFCSSGKNEFNQYMHEVCAPSEYFYEQHVLLSARKYGARIVISGWGSDEFLGLPNIPLYRSSLIQGNIGSFLRMRKEQKDQRLLSHLRDTLVSPLRNRPFYRLKTARNIGHYLRSFSNEAKVNKQAFASKNEYYNEMLSYLHLPGRMDDWYIQSSLSGLRYSYPFLNKKLIELLYSLPDHFFYGREFPDRYFIKKLAKNYLPKSIYNQSKSPDYQREAYFIELEDTWLWENKAPLLQFCKERFQHLIACDKLITDLSNCKSKGEIAPFRGILFLTAKNHFLTSWLEKNKS